ncbi:hypothetical protein B0H21DRAFT_436067 [Amylocystis lapponica]|nr:hypothetical protein B0H21DRAFT_436067 [Amylocystis lapponica]
MEQIAGRIRAPLKQGDRVARNPLIRGRVMAFNRQLLSYRQTAEWGMRGLQGSFGRLRLPLDIHRIKRRQSLLENCVRMNNVRARLIGISQIRNVYMPIWKDGDGDGVWEDLGNFLMRDIRRNDRVSRFHLVVASE